MSLYYMPESVSHPSNSLRVGLGTLRPLKAWKTDRGGCLGRGVQSMGLRDMYSAGDIIEYEGGAVGERLQSVVD